MSKTRLTTEKLQTELLCISAYCLGRSLSDSSGMIDWRLWADVCRDASHDLDLLKPPTVTHCHICEEPLVDCNCDPPF